MKSSKKSSKKNVYAFVDASNIIYGAKAEGWFIDLKKLFKYLKKKYFVTKAFFYYGKDSKSAKKEAFLKKLKSFGYILKVKEIKRYGKKSKSNCDVDMTMDMLLLMKEYTRAIVLTGDGDFAPLLAYLVSKKKDITVISSPKRTAREIRSLLGGKVQSFDDLKTLLEYKKRGGP